MLCEGLHVLHWIARKFASRAALLKWRRLQLVHPFVARS